MSAATRRPFVLLVRSSLGEAGSLSNDCCNPRTHIDILVVPYFFLDLSNHPQNKISLANPSVLINPFYNHRGCKNMKSKTTLFSTFAILLILLVTGLFYIHNQPAASQQPQYPVFASQGFDPDLYPLQDLTPTSGILVAMAKCGNETCSAQQCCCLNTDTGAQCCRPNSGGNCVEACKRGSPC